MCSHGIEVNKGRIVIGIDMIRPNDCRDYDVEDGVRVVGALDVRIPHELGELHLRK